jgi:hypothetical protein
MSYTERLQQGLPHELGYQAAIFPIGLPLTGISSPQFCKAFSQTVTGVSSWRRPDHADLHASPAGLSVRSRYG